MIKALVHFESSEYSDRVIDFLFLPKLGETLRILANGKVNNFLVDKIIHSVDLLSMTSSQQLDIYLKSESSYLKITQN